MDATGPNSDRITHTQILRDHVVLSVEERNDDENLKRLSEAVDSLHPSTSRSRLDALTIEIIDLLKEAREDNDPVTGIEMMDFFGLGPKNMGPVIETAIEDHRVWIEDNSDREADLTKITYHIVGEDAEPQDWTRSVTPKLNSDQTTATPRARKMREKRLHVAFLRAYPSLAPKRRVAKENVGRFTAAVEYLHGTSKTESRRPRQTAEETEAQRAVVRKQSTDPERLLAAVGNKGRLLSRLSHLLTGDEILDLVTRPDVQIAEYFIAVHGPDALWQCREALEHLDPPSRWAGLKPAVGFVRSLGFSAEWAGEPNTKPPEYLEVEGPYTLPELHGYQRSVVRNVRNMIRVAGVDRPRRRGMISMPTGSGKTRVAVQAVVEAMRDDGFDGGILWVADRDELCEQAVEAWRQIWSSIGTQATPLRISRLWGDQSRPQPTNSGHVVVATIQTLNARLKKVPDEYEFLADFTLIVFDEAHRSVAPTSTSVMQEIGLTRWQRSNEPFLLGLTATPYRGRDSRETRRLVNRYGSNRLDAGAFASDDPRAVIAELQEMQVLARADHETIDGAAFSLDARERKQASSAPWLPRRVEDRIAADSSRTRRIIEAYESHVKSDWPTLIFATSVDHAHTVAALLNVRGIRARAVVEDTKSASRRRIVNDFRRGQIKALVNYNVFREGFDAPRTRAIIVARPVFSPNLYFQMIGRGLRGVKNGGNDRCLILNVRDNIENYQRELAFADLDWLWDSHRDT
ncbi:MAG: DEAD/DEAH box helicase [Spirochaetaceae bacterium]|nr:DEAD/DEAH box helicase [Spirochaetaceae bacterium]